MNMRETNRPTMAIPVRDTVTVFAQWGERLRAARSVAWDNSERGHLSQADSTNHTSAFVRGILAAIPIPSRLHQVQMIVRSYRHQGEPSASFALAYSSQ